MKKQCMLLVVASLVLTGICAHAQNQNQKDDKTAPETQGGEVEDEITFGPETTLEEAIKLLAARAGVNYVLDPALNEAPGPEQKAKAKQPVTVKLRKVTPQQALTAILENYGLILIQDQRTKIGRITKKGPAEQEPLVTKIYQLEYANATNLVKAITPLLGGGRSKVIADERTGKLVVVATEADLATVDGLVTNLDAATKQVLIEARIVETTKNPRALRGIDWSGTLEAQEFSAGNNVGLGGLVGSPGVIVGRNPGGAFQFQPTAAFLNASGVSAVLSFINKDTESEIVSMPRTVTQDNRMARLEVTRAFPIFKVTPGSANVPASAEITYTNLGTILVVTPRIASYSNISLRVQPEVSDLADVEKQTLFDQVFSANVYAIRRMETTVMIPSGNTLVLGGLVAGDSKKNFTKVPVLGDIPGLGAAFRSQNKNKRKTNLLLFITPTIVENGDYQKTETTFLKTPVYEDYDEPLRPLDSAHPPVRNYGKKKSTATVEQ